MEKITVSEITTPTRIDIFLISNKKNLTRATAKKLIMNGEVTLDGRRVKPNYKLSNGETIFIATEKVESFLKSSPKNELKSVDIPFDIIFEDENTIVVNKPYGIVSHPVPGHRDDTLLNGILYYIGNKASEKNTRIRLVHRLDKDTSGVLLAAKDLVAHDFYSSQFEDNEIQKEYYAVVKGDFKGFLKYNSDDDFFEITTFMTRSSKDTKVYVSVDNSMGKIATTKIYFQKYWKGLNGVYSLVKVLPKTGRTHQIRVHLSDLGFPILGDNFYAGEEFDRLMLHAYSLKVKLLNSEQKIFVAELPDLFKY